MSKFEYSILPEYAPLYPALPYHYKNYEKVSVYCKGKVEVIARFLPKEFEAVGDTFEAFVLKNNEIQGLEPYSEGGLIIPCRYKDKIGACMAFEYVDTDDALCAGREIWGYPKKLGEIQFKKEKDRVRGMVKRRNKTIIEIDFKESDQSFEPPILFPRLQVKRMPHPERYGTDINWIIQNEFENMVIHKKVYGNAALKWEFSKDDPLAELGPIEVLGAIYTEGDFTLSYGKVLDQANQYSHTVSN
jgi:acetoacetate decarboxylase